MILLLSSNVHPYPIRNLKLHFFWLQVCQFIGRPASDSKCRQYWNFAHYWLGRTATVMGVMNIFVGFHGIASEQNLKMGFMVAFGTLLIMVIVFEGRMRRDNRNLNVVVDQPPVFRIEKS